MIKKFFLIFCLMITLVGCKSPKIQKVHFFYYDDCRSCHMMQEQLLSDMFFEDFEVETHNLDLTESRKLYHEYMGDQKKEGKLKNVEMGYRSDCLGPLLVFDGYGAYLGYSPEFKDEYLQDFKFLLNKGTLLECFESSRFLER